MKIPDVSTFKQEIPTKLLPKSRYYILSILTSGYFILCFKTNIFSDFDDEYAISIILGTYILLTTIILHLDQHCSITKLIWDALIIGFFTFFGTGTLSMLIYADVDVWYYILSFTTISFYIWKIIFKNINFNRYLFYSKNQNTDSLKLPILGIEQKIKILLIHLDYKEAAKIILIFIGSAVFSIFYLLLLEYSIDLFDVYGYFIIFGLILLALWEFFIQNSFSRNYNKKFRFLKEILPILLVNLINLLYYGFRDPYNYSAVEEPIFLLLVGLNIIMLEYSGILGLKRNPKISVAKNDKTQFSLKKTILLCILTWVFSINAMIFIGNIIVSAWLLNWIIYSIITSFIFNRNQNFTRNKKILNMFLITILSFFMTLLLYLPTSNTINFTEFLGYSVIFLVVIFYLWIFIIRQVNYSRLPHNKIFYQQPANLTNTIDQNISPEIQIIKIQEPISNHHCPVCKGPIESDYLDVLRENGSIYCVFCGSKIHKQEIFPPDTEHLMLEHEHILEKISRLQPIDEINSEVK